MSPFGDMALRAPGAEPRSVENDRRSLVVSQDHGAAGLVLQTGADHGLGGAALAPRRELHGRERRSGPLILIAQSSTDAGLGAAARIRRRELRGRRRGSHDERALARSGHLGALRLQAGAYDGFGRTTLLCLARLRRHEDDAAQKDTE